MGDHLKPGTFCECKSSAPTHCVCVCSCAPTTSCAPTPTPIPYTTSHSCRLSVRASAAAAGAQGGAADTPQQHNPFLRVVLPTALALLLCNLDRICLAVAIIPMSGEFGWHESLQVG